ncbi:MAG: helix-hairpin-helix domain-containing protein [bacterium]|nr:helix-hairpin-helix domain-containing protein [bacterium]
MAADRPEFAVRSAGLLLTVLALVLFAGLAGTATSVPLTHRAASEPAGGGTALRLDPNSAEWWELTVIPGVGEVTAKRVVDYRRTWQDDIEPPTGAVPSDPAAFHIVADLQRVKGIGSKTAARMAPYLSFPQ